MKIYKRGDNNKIIMHSDTYLGEDYTSPNMMHYKYIKKERHNGRWYYYYEDPKMLKLNKNRWDTYLNAYKTESKINELKKQAGPLVKTSVGKKLSKMGDAYVSKLKKKYEKAEDKYQKYIKPSIFKEPLRYIELNFAKSKIGRRIINFDRVS